MLPEVSSETRTKRSRQISPEEEAGELEEEEGEEEGEEEELPLRKAENLLRMNCRHFLHPKGWMGWRRTQALMLRL